MSALLFGVGTLGDSSSFIVSIFRQTFPKRQPGRPSGFRRSLWHACSAEILALLYRLSLPPLPDSVWFLKTFLLNKHQNSAPVPISCLKLPAQIAPVGRCSEFPRFLFCPDQGKQHNPPEPSSGEAASLTVSPKKKRLLSLFSRCALWPHRTPASYQLDNLFTY